MYLFLFILNLCCFIRVCSLTRTSVRQVNYTLGGVSGAANGGPGPLGGVMSYIFIRQVNY